MQVLLTLCLVFLSMSALLVHAFRFSVPTTQRTNIALRALGADQVAKLEEMKQKYASMVSSGADTSSDATKLKDIVECYESYEESGKILRKLRMLYKNEPIGARKAKQLKSFMELYTGRTELEQVLREKIGAPTLKVKTPPEVLEIMKLDKTIAELEQKYQETAIKVPEGKSTRDARFGSMKPNRSLSTTN